MFFFIITLRTWNYGNKKNKNLFITRFNVLIYRKVKIKKRYFISDPRSVIAMVVVFSTSYRQAFGTCFNRNNKCCWLTLCITIINKIITEENIIPALFRFPIFMHDFVIAVCPYLFATRLCPITRLSIYINTIQSNLPFERVLFLEINFTQVRCWFVAVMII